MKGMERGALLVLLDGWLGSGNQSNGWLGFKGNNCVATLDLMDINTYSKVSVQLPRKQKEWIFLPESVSVEVSNDGKNFVLVDKKILDPPSKEDKNLVQEINFSFYPKEHRYLRLTVKNIKECPEWHPGAGDDAWIFLDEIVINN